MSKKQQIIAGLLSALCGMMMLTPVARAANGHIYLSPGSRSTYNGSYVTVAVRLNSSSGVNSVQANLTYPADKLDYISTSYAGTAFEIQAESSGGGGNVRMARGSISSLTGDRLVGTVTFRAKSSSGSAVISFTGGTALVNNGSEVSSSKSGATVTFSVAPPPPAAPVKDETAPAITNIQVKGLTPSSATITWDTNEPADSFIQYGLDKKYGLNASNTQKVKKHKVVLSSSFLLPKNDYQFIVSSSDASGNKRTSSNIEFTTPGVPYIIIVKDQEQNPVGKVKVTIDGETIETNDSGEALFGLSLGKKTIHIAYGDYQTTENIEITPDDIKKTDLAKEISLPFVNRKSIWIYLFIGGTAGLALVYGIYRYLTPLKTLKKHRFLYWVYKKTSIASIQKHYGDKNSKTNPYYSSLFHNFSKLFVKK